jgi:stearoyl-CoA desaturase (delta-9 desaturase)
MQPVMEAAYSGLTTSSLPIRDQPKQNTDQLSQGSATAESPELISRTARLIDLTAIILPFLVFIAAVTLMWGRGFGWTDLGIMIGMYLLTGLGVTVGFHRLFAHKAFQTQRITTLIIAVLGSMSVQGPLLWWVALHRRHHHHSDEEGDPHSPHTHGSSVRGLIAGAWHSHVGWLFKSDAPGTARYVPDLIKDRALRLISESYPLWAALGLIVPAVVGGIISRSWLGALSGLIWGGLVRVFLVHHITWSVNSVCHIWGSRPYNSHDHSRNNFIVGILALGEGWHNNHHAFPTSARHGLHWWQFDITWCVIRTMQLLGLASAVRVPATSMIQAKRDRQDR